MRVFRLYHEAMDAKIQNNYNPFKFMKHFIATLTITILSTCILKAQLPKKGLLYKENFEIHGVKVYNMTLRYTLSRSGTAYIPSKLGMPTGSLGMEYSSEGKVSLAGCEPNFYLKLVSVNSKTKQKYIGWLKTPRVDAINDSGKSLTGGTTAFEITGEPMGTEFQHLIRTSPRHNATFWPEENARSFYITAYVEDFEIEESPTCGARERMFNQKMRDNKIKENEIKNNAIQEANGKANSEATALINQLPTSEQTYFRGRLSDIIVLAPQLQQKAYDRLQNDLLTKTSEIEDQNVRKAALQIKRTEQESNLNKQLSEVNNPKDRAELGNRLAELKQSKSITIDMEYAQLESDIRKALESEKRVNQEIAEFKNTYETQNSDFKSRSGAMQTNGEMNRIMDDPSLRSEEKERQILQKQIQLNNNISVYNDDTQKMVLGI